MVPKDAEFDDEIKQSLEALRPVPPRDAQAAEQGRIRYLKQAHTLRQEMQSRPALLFRNWVLAFLYGWQRKEPKLMLKPAIALVLALALIFGSAGAAAYAAHDSLPNEALYPVKLVMEDVQLAMTGNNATGLALLQEMIQRRLQELVSLANQGVTVPAQVGERLQQHLDQSLIMAANMEDPAMNQALQQIKTQTAAAVQTISQFGQTGDPTMEKVRVRLEEQLRLSDMGLGDANTFRYQIRHRYEKSQASPTATSETQAAEGSSVPAAQATGTPGSGPGPGPMNPTITPPGFSPGPGPFGPGAGPTFGPVWTPTLQHPGTDSPGPGGPGGEGGYGKP